MLINQTPHFQIHRLYAHNSLRNYTYVVVETATRLGWVIDPWDGEAVLHWAEKEGVSLSGILNTHQHHDHIKGNAVLEQQGVKVLAGIEAILPHIGEKHTWSTPGHTMEHQVFYLKDQADEHLFAGDTLFQAGVGNCKNGGEPSVLFQTLQKLKTKLTAATLLHPGHDYLERNLAFALHVEPSNQVVQSQQHQIQGLKTYECPAHRWDLELQINPFLRLSNAELRLNSLATSSGDDEITFKMLRQLRDTW